MATRVELTDKLKMAREMMGLSQRALSSKIGIAPTTIANWETGLTHPSPEHQKKITIWLQQAEKQLNTSSVPTPSDPPENIRVPMSRRPGGRLPPQLKDRVIECLKAGMSHRQIKAVLKVDLHDITGIRHETGIPVRSRVSKQADHIEQLWNAARNETRAFAPSKLLEGDRISFAMALQDIQGWLTRYIEANLTEALDPKRIKREVHRILR